MPIPVPTQNTAIEATLNTTLEVAKLASSPTFSPVSLADEISFKPTGTTTKYETYDSVWSRNVKTSLEGALTFKSAAPNSDTALGLLIAAGFASGSSSNLFFRIKNPDGSYTSGTMVVKDAEPVTQSAKNVFMWQFNAETDGAPTYTSAANAV